jgi:hypothetical protein
VRAEVRLESLWVVGRGRRVVARARHDDEQEKLPRGKRKGKKKKKKTTIGKLS